MNPDKQLEQNPVAPLGPIDIPPQATSTPRPDIVGAPMKSLKGGKATFAIILLVVFAGIFILAGGFIFLPILIPVVIWYVWTAKRQRNAIMAFAASHGYTFQSNTVLNDLDGVIFQAPEYIIGQDAGSSKGYMMGWLVYGQIGGRAFRMYEHSLDDGNNNSGNNGVGFSASSNKRTGDFDVMDIAVSGEGLQFLLISNTHQSMLNRIHISLKRYQLEGDFNKYFTLYGADGAEVEVLRIFTPDVMAILIDQYQNYSLELTPQHFFLYRGNASLSQTETNCESLVGAATDLSAKFFSGIEKVHYAENAVVPASVTIPSDQSRIAGGFPIWAAIIVSIVVFVFGGFVTHLISSDQKIPAGYVKATDAKVSHDKTITSQTTNNSNSYSYQITAAYTVNGRSYWYQDTLYNDHPVGSSVNLYYDPANPTQADFVGGHSSAISEPILIGFLSIPLLVVWVAYFVKKQRR